MVYRDIGTHSGNGSSMIGVGPLSQRAYLDLYKIPISTFGLHCLYGLKGLKGLAVCVVWIGQRDLVT